MPPKAKAVQLFEKYYYLYGEGVKLSGESMTREDARACALIAVDEIILETDEFYEDYWQEVKRELEAL